MPECPREFDEQHFRNGWSEVAKFFARFGHEPEFAGRRLLDVGCGRGNMVLHAARKGAALATGVDLDEARIRFATEMAAKESEQVRARTRFLAGGIDSLPQGETFDLIVSKDTFEHVMDVPGVLAQMRDRLAPGGRIHLGFGPLYRSPFGDHHWAEADLPWGHLYLPEKMLLRRIERRTGHHYTALAQLDLNQWSRRQFLDAFAASGLAVESLGINRGSHWIYRLSRPLAAVPVLGEFLTFNIYAVLRRG